MDYENRSPDSKELRKTCLGMKLKLQDRQREQSVSIESVLSVSGLEECCWCLRIESGSSTMKP